MRKQKLPAFFLEFILSLVILSISMGVILTMFVKAYQIDQRNQALQNILIHMMRISEEARDPNTVYDTIITLKFDPWGQANCEEVRYQLILTPRLEGNLRTVEVRLEDVLGQVLKSWNIQSFVEVSS